MIAAPGTSIANIIPGARRSIASADAIMIPLQVVLLTSKTSRMSRTRRLKCYTFQQRTNAADSTSAVFPRRAEEERQTAIGGGHHERRDGEFAQHSFFVHHARNTGLSD